MSVGIAAVTRTYHVPQEAANRATAESRVYVGGFAYEGGRTHAWPGLAPCGVPSPDVGQDVLMVAGDLVPGRLAHVDEGELGPRRMLRDLVPLAEEYELEVPVVLGAVDLGEDVRAVEGEHRQAELLLEDPLRRGDRRFPDHEVGRGKHPTFAVHLRAFLVEGPDVVPWTRGIQVAHQHLRGTASPADHEERREAEPALRDLARRHRPIDGGEPGELTLRRHGRSNPVPNLN